MQRHVNNLVKSLYKTSENNFATKMSAGSTSNSKDSAGRRLGVKKFGGMEVFPGDILVRQRGLKWHPGDNTYIGKDHTIHSKVEGVVEFSRFKQNFHRGTRAIIHVRQQTIPNRYIHPPKPHNYHPQLFPHLAQFNWPPTNYKIYKQQPLPPKPTKPTGYSLIQQQQQQQSTRVQLTVEQVNHHVMQQQQSLQSQYPQSLGEYSQQYLYDLQLSLGLQDHPSVAHYTPQQDDIQIE